MTPRQLKESTSKELVIAYKNKARCYHSARKARAIYNELENRLGGDTLFHIRLGAWHMEHGEGDKEFNAACDELIGVL